MDERQIHLEAVEQSKKIDKIYDKLQKGESDGSIQTQIASSIRFFGKNITKLQESNASILKLGRCFLNIGEKLDWSLRDSNAFLLMIINLLLKRKDENVVRETCDIVKEFLGTVPEQNLRSLVKIHHKEIQYLFNKLTRVSTFVSQMKLLEILTPVLQIMEDGGAKIIKKNRFVAICSNSMVSDTVEFFQDLDLNNFVDTSRSCLDFFNHEVLKKPFIFSISCYCLKLNGVNFESQKTIVDFNLKNLSVSLFVSTDKFNKNAERDETYLIEIEDCNFTAEKGKFNEAHYIEVILKPSRSQVMDEKLAVVHEMPGITSLVLVVIENSDIFWSEVYPKFKEKTPLVDELHTDLESLASFRTMNTVIERQEHRPKPVNLSISRQENVALEAKSPPKKPSEINKNSEDLFTLSELQSSTEPPVVTPKVETELKPKQTATVGPMRKSLLEMKLSQPRDESVYDDVPRDEEELPSAKNFFRTQRQQRKSQSQLMEPTETTVADDPEDYTWAPSGQKKTPAQRKAPFYKKRDQTPNAGGKKPRSRVKTSRKSSDIDNEVTNVFDSEVFEPLPPVQPQTKRKSRQTSAQKRVPKNKKNETISKDELNTTFLPKQESAVKTRKRAAPKAKAAPAPKRAATNKKTQENLNYDLNTSSGDEEAVTAPKPKPAPAPNRAAANNKAQPNLTYDLNLSCGDEREVIAPKPKATPATKRAVSGKKAPQNFTNDLNTSSDYGKEVTVVNTLAERKKIAAELKEGSAKLDKVLAKREQKESEAKVPASKNIVEARRSILKNILQNEKSAEPKPSSDFDALLREKVPSTDRVVRKRPAVDEEIVPPKQSKPNPTKFASKPVTKTREDASESDKENLQEFTPYTQFQPSPEQENINFNHDVRTKRQMLDRYITQVETTIDYVNKGASTSGYKPNLGISNIDDIIENFHPTQTQKKLSPTIHIRNYQFQEISITPPKDDDDGALVEYDDRFSDDELGRKLEIEAEKALEPLVEQIKGLMSSLGNSERKEELKRVVQVCRNSSENFQSHIQEHIRLLKRVQHSKSRMTQLFDKNIEIVNGLMVAIGEFTEEVDKNIEKNRKKLEEIRQEAMQKQQDVMKTVWKSFVNKVYAEVNTVLQKHLKL